MPISDFTAFQESTIIYGGWHYSLLYDLEVYMISMNGKIYIEEWKPCGKSIKPFVWFEKKNKAGWREFERRIKWNKVSEIQ